MIDMIMTATTNPPKPEAKALQAQRQFLLQEIALAANEIKQIDRRLEVLRSQELEADLLRGELL